MELWREGSTIHAAGHNGDDLALCGYAFEGEAAWGGGDDECVVVTRGRINCLACLTIIRFCKAIPARKLATTGDDHG